MRGGARIGTGPKPKPAGTHPCLNAETCVVAEHEGFHPKEAIHLPTGQWVGLARPGNRYCEPCHRHWSVVSNGW